MMYNVLPQSLQYLIGQSDRFYPEHLFEDVQRSVYELHTSRQIHNRICSDLGTCASSLVGGVLSCYSLIQIVTWRGHRDYVSFSLG